MDDFSSVECVVSRKEGVLPYFHIKDSCIGMVSVCSGINKHEGAALALERTRTAKWSLTRFEGTSHLHTATHKVETSTHDDGALSASPGKASCKGENVKISVKQNEER